MLKNDIIYLVLYYIMNFFLNRKKIMKQYMNSLSDKCHTCKLSSKSIGILIRSFHLNAPPFFMYNLLFGPYIMCNIVMLFLIIAGFLFYTFDMCFLSVMEQNLCNDNFVIMDPILELCNLEVNTQNRYYISNMIGIPYLITVFLIYYFRFYM